MPANLFVGLDGCRGGWIAVVAKGDDALPLSWRLFASIDETIRTFASAAMIGVDMPLGLAEEAARGGRQCDRDARQILGRRRSSVFSPPVRSALVFCDDYSGACEANAASSDLGLRLSRQTFNIMPKIRELDDAMSPVQQARVKEVHPELAFWHMAGGQATTHGKKTKAGQEERLRLLTTQGFGDIADSYSAFPRSSVQIDDLLDAAAVCWVARKIAHGTARQLPEHPVHDAKGLAMEIWF